MIEVIVRDYLKSKLGVPIYVGEKPSPKPEEYIVLQVIDGGRIDLIDAVTFNLESYSTTLLKAAELNKKVKEAMYDIVELPQVSSSKCGGGGQNIDAQTKSYCYEAVFNLFYMED